MEQKVKSKEFYHKKYLIITLLIILKMYENRHVKLYRNHIEND